jgi:hypothetical protein
MGSEFYEAEIYAHMGAGTTNTYGYGAFGGAMKSGITGERGLDEYIGATG